MPNFRMDRRRRVLPRRLYEVTGDRAFLDGALDGARFLLSIADTSNDGCRVFHHSNDDDARDDADGRAHYFGCAMDRSEGTDVHEARAGDGRSRLDRLDAACANTVRASGIPEQSTPGSWNNVGLCCGSAGAAIFFERLAGARSRTAESTGGRLPVDPPRVRAEMLAWTLAHGTRDEHGLRFPQAEHRVKPELVEAQVD